jgi:signal transduction histidine kinase
LLELAFQRLDRLDLAERGQVQWEKVFDASSEMFVFHEPEGRIFRVNLAVSSFLGRPLASCIGARCEDLFPGLCAGHDFEGQRWTDSGSGRVFQVSTQVAAVGRAPAVLHVLHEVTEQLRLQQLALEKDHMEFSAKLLDGVAHEIRNPLFALSAVTQALSKELGPESRVASHVSHILEQVRRMDALVKRFLSVSFAPGPPGTAPQPAAQVLARALDLISQRCPAGSRERVAVSVEGEGLFLPASGDSLPQALFDLIENALTFSPPEERVDVSLGRRGGQVLIVVRDRGPGLAPQARANLFVPFFTTRPGRTGLGLASAKAVVTRLGGSIEAAEGASPGAAFLIAFPAGNGK